jgi:hypothetical protein
MGSIVFFTFATACAIIAICHEVRWRRMLQGWDRTKGTIVGFAESRPVKTLFGEETPGDDGPYPEIEFLWNGSAHRFISRYGGSGTPSLGSVVNVLFDPASGTAEHLSFTNRWLFSLIPAGFSVIFFWVAFHQ